MGKTLNAILRLFLEPGPMPAVFIVFSMGLSFITSAFYDQLKATFSTPKSILLLVGGVLLILMGVTVLLRQIFRPKVVISSVKPRRGLIVLVSQGEVDKIPATDAINYHYSPDKKRHTLEYCWLFRTPPPEKEPPEPARSSWVNAQLLEERYRGKVKMILKSVEMDDPESVAMALEQVHQEARKLKLKENEIVSDITGGTKMMGVGMALASIAAGIDMTYLRARKTLPDGRADTSAGSDPMRVDIEFYRKEAAKV